MGRVVLATVLVLAWTAPALAGESQQSRRAEAVGLFEKGEAQYEAERYDAAADLFLKAWELYEDPAYLFNIGLSYEKQERWALAVRYYGMFLETFPDSAAASEVERRLRGAEQSRDAERATVVVDTDPPGAEARLTSDPAAGTCRTPCELRTDPGPATLRVILDDRGVGRARSLSAGETWRVDIALPEGSTSLAGPDHTWSWVSYGLGAAAAVSGAVVGGLALRDHRNGRDLADQSVRTPGEEAELADLRGRVRRRAVAADVSFGLAAVGVVVGTVLRLTADEAEEEPAVSVGSRGARWTVWRF